MIAFRAAAIVPVTLTLMLFWTSPAAAQGASCTISTTSVAFGQYDVFSASDVSSTGSVTIRCNASAKPVAVTLSQGQSGTYANRSLVKSGETLTYNLYLDAACTTVWGDSTAGTQLYYNADPPNNTNVVLTVYGRIPALQDVSAGAYGDTVIATVHF